MFEHLAFKHKSRSVLDYSFDKFRIAAKSGFTKLDEFDYNANAQSHKFARASSFIADQQQRFLSATIQMISARAPHWKKAVMLFALFDFQPQKL